MNLYFVLGRQHTYYPSHESLEPPEPCCVAELVLARSRGQARYLAAAKHQYHCYVEFEREKWKHTWLLARRPKETEAHVVTNERRWRAGWRLVDQLMARRADIPER